MANLIGAILQFFAVNVLNTGKSMGMMVHKDGHSLPFRALGVKQWPVGRQRYNRKDDVK